MLSKINHYWIPLIVGVLCLVPIAAQEASPGEIEPGAEVEVYQIRNQDVGDMMSLLHAVIEPYPSSISPRYNTITLTAPKPVHDMVRKLIAQYDRPSPTLDLQFYLLVGRRSGPKGEVAVPDEVSTILKDLKNVTNFKSFQLVASPSIKTIAGKPAGVEGGAEASRYSISLGPTRVIEDESIRVERLQVELLMVEGKSASGSMQISFDIEDGETIVLGSSEMNSEKGEALIVVLTANASE